MERDQITEGDAFQLVPTIEQVDATITDPPYPNGMGLFTDDLIEGLAMLYYACKKTKNYVVFFWNPHSVPKPPTGWYEVARHVWHKPDTKTNTHYEAIVVWSRDYRRKTSRVWSIPILDYRSYSYGDWQPHPTQKPVRLVRYLIDLYTKEGETVLDPFAGSGTTGVACQQLKRHYYLIERNPDFVKICKERLERHEQNDDTPASNNATAKSSAKRSHAASKKARLSDAPHDDREPMEHDSPDDARDISPPPE